MTTTKNNNVLLHDYSVWGVEAHGVRLHINPNVQISKQRPWVIDIENNQDGTCAGIGIANDLEDIFFFTDIEDKNFFNGVELVGHNIKYDVQMLRSWGFNVSPDQIIWDTQVAEYVRNSTTNKYGLKDLSRERYGAAYPTYEELCGKGKKAISIGSLDRRLVAHYNACDVFYTSRLCTDQLETFTPTELEYMRNIELPTLRVLLEMEERGVEIDATYLRDLDARFNVGLSSVVANIRNVAGSEVNPNSPKQVTKLLMDKCGLRLKTTEADELEKHQRFPLVKDLLRYRQLKKLIGTYTQGLLEEATEAPTYRLHARFNQTIVATGRLSSSGPNLQNIPNRTPEGRQVRNAFIPKAGYVFKDVDYSQIQPSLMAHYSQDPAMLEIFRSGKSIYSLVTSICDLLSRFNGDESEAKAVAKILWLALAFNAGPYALSIQTGLSFKECQSFIQQMEKKLDTFFYWKNKTIAQCEIDGYVTTLFGRRIPISREWAHLAPNYLMQGGESEIVKLSQAATRHLTPVIAVHDEVLFEVPQDKSDEIDKELNDVMANIVTLSVPLRVEIGTGRNWNDAKNG